MIRALNSFIDRTTMYRLVLYYLLVLFGAALLFSSIGVLTFITPPNLLWSGLVFVAVSWATNEFFAWAFDAVTNFESVYITALILTLIMSPVAFSDLSGTAVLAGIAATAMASKYILAIGKKHLFNPAALAVMLSGLCLGVYASWWVAGNLPLLPFILIGGILMVKKLRKADLVLAFIATAMVTVAITSLNPVTEIRALFEHTTLFFFAFVMLTEPLTMPNKRKLRILYGILVGVLFVPAVHTGVYFSPERALLVGNLFTYFVSPKRRYMLSFVERRPLANGIFEYLFRSDRVLRFKPGQYLEWTLGGVPLDARGNRRFFTIASAPESDFVALGVRFYDKPSAFKRTLAALEPGAEISVASLAGDFTMPKDTKRKLAFIAGGIGVTPFASMARHAHAAGESRDAVLIYNCKAADEIAYKEVFTNAARLGWRTIYAVPNDPPLSIDTHLGLVDMNALVKKEIPDYLERLFYVSGPPAMVDAMKAMLLALGVSRFNIKTDFFPGLA